MLSMLEYLCSPVQFPSIQEMADKVLGPDSDINDSDHQQKLIKALGKEFHPQLIQCPFGPFYEILEAFDQPLLIQWDNAFSTKLSPFMHLLRSAEEAESGLYMQNYAAYFKEVVTCTKCTIAQSIAELLPGDITGPALKNLVIKLHWFFLGFHPVNEPHITLSTPYPRFSELVMPSIMTNWNTTTIHVNHHPSGEEVNFGDILIEVSDHILIISQC